MSRATTSSLVVRSTDRREGFRELAAELVRLKVDVIVAGSATAIEPAHKATASIPIVMVMASDPVASGFVASLARPGSNITGLTSQYKEIGGKLLQLLNDALPGLSRVAVLWESPDSATRRTLGEAQAAAAILRLRLQAIEVRNVFDVDDAFAAATRAGAGAAVMGGPMAYSHRHQIAQLGIKHRLPLAGPADDYAEAGWLIGYGPSYVDHMRRAADYVDRILKGARPAELPVEQPTRFHLSINLATSKALGLALPAIIVQRADQLIE